MKVLVVDDDADMLAVTGFALQQAGYLVVKATTFGNALGTFRAELPDCAILDINLPGGSGFDLCAALRRESDVPILMLTVRGDEADLVRALELGADDYLTKPFSPRTLIARIKALLRRARVEEPHSSQAGELDLDLGSLTLRIGADRQVKVTPLEARLLHLLIANAGQPLSLIHI